ncbi:MAG TPA: pyridoxamine 5'-phosphate oxidase family protein [Candidatus Deferrimicrobiaceae bacterium]|nr:pyridoxamine 5'-phosphate oxidase family protein [Candidatus Deferrimicrobiaceae bacterium]
MGKTRSMIDDEAKRFIEAQHIFFVASAPLDSGGHVNLSPKGLDTFRILGPTTVAYVDFNGSGVETIAHLKENGRIVLMFCAFQGPPNIFRLYGFGRAVEPHQDEFAALAQSFPAYETIRSIIVIEITRVTDSCGYGVPHFRYEGEREQLAAWARKQGPEGLQAYRERKNQASIDGLPGLSLHIQAVHTPAVHKQAIHKQDRLKDDQKEVV